MNSLTKPEPDALLEAYYGLPMEAILDAYAPVRRYCDTVRPHPRTEVAQAMDALCSLLRSGEVTLGQAKRAVD
jgi:hypothetical protein